MFGGTHSPGYSKDTVKHYKGGRDMLPEMTIENKTATIGAGAPTNKSIEEKFSMLTDEEKEKVILFVEQLKADRYNR